MRKILNEDPRCRELVARSRKYDGLDITDESSVATHSEKLEDKKFHLLICATGALTVNGIGPEKALRQLDPDAMAAQFRLNAIGSVLVTEHFLPLLDQEIPVIGAFLSARVGSIGDNRLAGWISYRSSKALLNQIVRAGAKLSTGKQNFQPDTQLARAFLHFSMRCYHLSIIIRLYY